jgi:flagellar biogenesis protein FliO
MIYAYLQMLIALAAVIGLIVLVGYFLRKKQATGSMMKILGYQPIGPRKGIVAVKVCDDVLLLSLTATDLRLLKTYDADQFNIVPETAPGAKETAFKTLRDKLL